MDSCECGDTGNDGNGDKGPEHCRNREKEQKTCQFVGRSVREAESFADYQRKDLIDKFNHNYSPAHIHNQDGIRIIGIIRITEQ